VEISIRFDLVENVFYSVGEQSKHNNQQKTNSDHKIYDVTFQDCSRDEMILVTWERLIRNNETIDVSKYDCISIGPILFIDSSKEKQLTNMSNKILQKLLKNDLNIKQ